MRVGENATALKVDKGDRLLRKSERGAAALKANKEEGRRLLLKPKDPGEVTALKVAREGKAINIIVAMRKKCHGHAGHGIQTTNSSKE